MNMTSTKNRFWGGLLYAVIPGIPFLGVLIWQQETATKHPFFAILLGFIYWLIVAVIKFSQKIIIELEERWTKSIATWIEHQLRLRCSSYHRQYVNYVIDRCHVLYLRNLPTRGAITPEIEPVYVDLQVIPQAIHRASYTLIRENVSKDKRIIWNYLEDDRVAYETLVILGPPGSGKTTLLKYLALAHAHNKQRQYSRKIRTRIPILFNCKSLHSKLNKCQTTLPALAQIAGDLHKTNPRFPSPDWFEGYLNQGQCLVMLDGIDEISSSADRSALIQWIDEQISLYNGNRFIVTARPVGYRSQPLQHGTTLEIQPFSAGQSNKFIRAWYLHFEAAQSKIGDSRVAIRANHKSQDLISCLRMNPSINDLASNPLLLTMIALVHQYRGKLPERRVDLYRDIIDLFTRQWHERSDIQHFHEADGSFIEMLRNLAMRMTRDCRTTQLSLDEITVQIQKVLHDINVNGDINIYELLVSIESNSGILHEKEQGIWSFAHTTFQEYLTAAYFDRYPNSCNIREWLKDSSWHEVTRLYAGMGNSSHVVDLALNVLHEDSRSQNERADILSLAHDCILQSNNVRLDLRQSLENEVISGLDCLENYLRTVCAEIVLSTRLHGLRDTSSTLCVDESHISYAEYQLFLDDISSKGDLRLQPDHRVGESEEISYGLSPISGIRYSDAIAFCEWLTLREQQRGSAHIRYRLPTASELEFNNPELLDSQILSKLNTQNSVKPWLADGSIDFIHNNFLPHSDHVSTFLSFASDCLSAELSELRDPTDINSPALRELLQSALGGVMHSSIALGSSPPKVDAWTSGVKRLKDISSYQDIDAGVLIHLDVIDYLKEDINMVYNRVSTTRVRLRAQVSLLALLLLNMYEPNTIKLSSNALLDIQNNLHSLLLIEGRIHKKLPSWEGLKIVRETTSSNTIQNT